MAAPRLRRKSLGAAIGCYSARSRLSGAPFDESPPRSPAREAARSAASLWMRDCSSRISSHFPSERSLSAAIFARNLSRALIDSWRSGMELWPIHGPRRILIQVSRSSRGWKGHAGEAALHFLGDRADFPLEFPDSLQLPERFRDEIHELVFQGCENGWIVDVCRHGLKVFDARSWRAIQTGRRLMPYSDFCPSSVSFPTLMMQLPRRIVILRICSCKSRASAIRMSARRFMSSTSTRTFRIRSCWSGSSCTSGHSQQRDKLDGPRPGRRMVP